MIHSLAFFSGLGPAEFVALVVLGIILYGKNLPTVARTIGRTIGEFKRQMREVEESIKREAFQDEMKQMREAEEKKDRARQEREEKQALEEKDRAMAALPAPTEPAAGSPVPPAATAPAEAPAPPAAGPSGPPTPQP